MRKTKLGTKKLSKYMNLLNDWGFKYVFNKEEKLIHFLNLLFEGKEEIKSIIYLSTEQLGKTEEDRKAIFDVYCRNDRGELILLEMQNISQAYFQDRSLFYSTFPLRNQALKGEWDFELKSVYVIGILNFIPRRKADEQYIERVCLINECTKEQYSDKLNFINVILPKFNKAPEELSNYLDCWLYILKHSKKLESKPEEIRGELFDELFKEIEVKRLKGENMEAYRSSELRYEDLYNFTSYAKQEGIIEGEKKGERKGEQTSKFEISRRLLEMGLSVSDISLATGLTPKQIRQVYPV